MRKMSHFVTILTTNKPLQTQKSAYPLNKNNNLTCFIILETCLHCYCDHMIVYDE